jgi:hypothetical protein
MKKTLLPGFLVMIVLLLGMMFAYFLYNVFPPEQIKTETREDNTDITNNEVEILAEVSVNPANNTIPETINEEYDETEEKQNNEDVSDSYKNNEERNDEKSNYEGIDSELEIEEEYPIEEPPKAEPNLTIEEAAAVVKTYYRYVTYGYYKEAYDLIGDNLKASSYPTLESFTIDNQSRINATLINAYENEDGTFQVNVLVEYQDYKSKISILVGIEGDTPKILEINFKENL